MAAPDDRRPTNGTPDRPHVPVASLPGQRWRSGTRARRRKIAEAKALLALARSRAATGEQSLANVEAVGEAIRQLQAQVAAGAMTVEAIMAEQGCDERTARRLHASRRRTAQGAARILLQHYRDLARVGLLDTKIEIDARSVQVGATREDMARLLEMGGDPIERFLKAGGGE